MIQDLVTKGAQDAIRPYLEDKDKLISVAKTLQDSHYKLLTTHADLSRFLQAAMEQVKEKRDQAQQILKSYNEHKFELADMADLAVGKCPLGQICTLPNLRPEDLQSKMKSIQTLGNNIQNANEHITSLLSKIEEHSDSLKEVTSTKVQNTVLSQLIQNQLQTLAK